MTAHGSRLSPNPRLPRHAEAPARDVGLGRPPWPPECLIIVPHSARLAGGAKLRGGPVLRWTSFRTNHTPFAARAVDVRVNEFVESRVPSPLSHLSKVERYERHVAADVCNPRILFSSNEHPCLVGLSRPAHCWTVVTTRTVHAVRAMPVGSSSRSGRFVPRRRAPNRTGGIPSPDDEDVRARRPSHRRAEARFVDPRVTGASDADEPGHLPSTSSREGIGRPDGLATARGVTRYSSRRALARR